MGRPFLFGVLALLWWLFGLYCLFKPAGVASGIPYGDKLGHLLLFGVQAGLLRMAGLGWRHYLPWLAGWGVLSELLQGWLTSDRSCEALDVLADWLGILLAGLVPGRGRRV